MTDDTYPLLAAWLHDEPVARLPSMARGASS
jgi:hypothetical protein